MARLGGGTAIQPNHARAFPGVAIAPVADRQSPQVDSPSGPRTSYSLSSDKENASPDRDKEISSSQSQGQRKRKSRARPMSDQERVLAGSSKRRRTREVEQAVDEEVGDSPTQLAQTQAARQRQRELESRGDKNFYDPDQNEDDKRATRRSLRALAARVNDSRSEFLQPGSKGIQEALEEADKIYSNVKQTDVATIDSRLLVTVGDLAYRKVNTLTLGDSTTGVDVDDFVTQCIAFMRRGNTNDPGTGTSTATQSSQAARRRQRQAEVGDDEEDAEPMNWSHLGRNAALLYNSRPACSGFLLGPLSVQKKVRQQTQRRARQTQASLTQAARPLELAQEDLEKQESANLTVICGVIWRLLSNVITEGTREVETEFEALEDEPSDAEIRSLMSKHGLTDNGCVPLFNFCVNPRSFGQTVENMFYVSFLIKEGKVGLDFDSNGLPTLGVPEQRTVKERQETQRNQAVFTLDFDIWQELVDSFGIDHSIIPHRREEKWDDGVLEDGVDVEDRTDEADTE